MKRLMLLLLFVSACHAARPGDSGEGDGDAAADVPAADAAPDAPEVDVASATDIASQDVSDVTGPCDDGDPCTVDDVIGPDGCKGKAKSCDDGSPCTIDVCQLDGTCTNKPNMHWDCLPDLIVFAPPRTVQVTAMELPEDGTIVAPLHGTKTAKLAVQGKDVAVAADQTFATTLTLEWGPQAVVTALVDQFGGTRARTQGVTASTKWGADNAAIASGLVQGVEKVGLPTTLTAHTPYTGQAREVQWQFTQQASSGLVTLAATPTPTTQLVAAPGDLGIPLHVACTAVTLDETPTRWQLTADLFNAALRASWLAGALEDDISPLIADLYPPLTFTGTSHGRAPWQLNACQPGAWTLTLLDLQFDIVGHLGDATFPVQVLLTLTAPADVVLNAGVLELRLGAPVQVLTDVTVLPDTFQGTDGAVGIAQTGHDKIAPALVAGWQKGALVSLAVPGATGVKLGAGVLRAE